MERRVSIVVASMFMLALVFCHGTDAKCKQQTYKLPVPCNHDSCDPFCTQHKYESGTCGFTGDPDEILCYCITCDEKTLVDQMAPRIQGDTNGA